MIRFANSLQNMMDATRAVDWLAPLALRLYLAPVFWVAGMNKATGFGGVVDWFGNDDYGLGLPMPMVLAILATGAELVGAVCLLIGFATRWICIPLMITMIVAATLVHWGDGWQAIHDPQSAFASQWVGGLEAEDAAAAGERLDKAKDVLKRFGNYEWLTGKGNFAMLNNGMEFAVTYLVMLLALFFTGAGRFFSVDYWLRRNLREPVEV